MCPLAFSAFEAQRHTGALSLDHRAGIEPAWAWFKAKLGCQQPNDELNWR